MELLFHFGQPSRNTYHTCGYNTSGISPRLFITQEFLGSVIAGHRITILVYSSLMDSGSVC